MNVVVRSTKRGAPLQRLLKVREHDLVASIEAAYNVDADDEAWMMGMLQSVHPALDQGGGLLGYFYDGTAGEVRLYGHAAFGESNIEIDNLVPVLLQLGPDEMHDMLLRCPRVMASASEVLTVKRVQELAAANSMDLKGINDTVGIKCHEPEGWGAMVGFAVPHLTRVDAKTESFWARLAAHATAALRIRRRLRAVPGAGPPDAVLNADGKVIHAEPDAKDA